MAAQVDVLSCGAIMRPVYDCLSELLSKFLVAEMFSALRLDGPISARLDSPEGQL